MLVEYVLSEILKIIKIEEVFFFSFHFLRFENICIDFTS